jgi:polyisoprenoid-binding protein YceI
VSDRVEATIEAASVHTRDEQRDAHLKSADFFYVEKFPTLHFKSTGINLAGEGELLVEGDLTIRGVTRKVRFAVEGPTPPTKDPWGNTRVAISASTRSTARTSASPGTLHSRLVAFWSATRSPSLSM